MGGDSFVGKAIGAVKDVAIAPVTFTVDTLKGENIAKSFNERLVKPTAYIGTEVTNPYVLQARASEKYIEPVRVGKYTLGENINAITGNYLTNFKKTAIGYSDIVNQKPVNLKDYGTYASRFGAQSLVLALGGSAISSASAAATTTGGAISAAATPTLATFGTTRTLGKGRISPEEILKNLGLNFGSDFKNILDGAKNFYNDAKPFIPKETPKSDQPFSDVSGNSAASFSSSPLKKNNNQALMLVAGLAAGYLILKGRK